MSEFGELERLVRKDRDRRFFIAGLCIGVIALLVVCAPFTCSRISATGPRTDDPNVNPGLPESRWCCDDNELSCVYGPGIVGRRRCTLMNRWGQCEPDPRYRTVPDGG